MAGRDVVHYPRRSEGLLRRVTSPAGTPPEVTGYALHTCFFPSGRRFSAHELEGASWFGGFNLCLVMSPQPILKIVGLADVELTGFDASENMNCEEDLRRSQPSNSSKKGSRNGGI